MSELGELPAGFPFAASPPSGGRLSRGCPALLCALPRSQEEAFPSFISLAFNSASVLAALTLVVGFVVLILSGDRLNALEEA